MKIAVKDLRPNPFRDLKRYPISAEKVDALTASIRDTDFWDNLLARKADDGGFELAYGVHRLAALKKAGVDEIDIPVRKLSDTVMAQIMAHENQAEWASSAAVAQETIRAIVLGFAAGRIELPKTVNKAGPVRHAPSFLVGAPEKLSERPESFYTAATLAKFLGGEKAGWPESKIEVILQTLASIEKDLISEAEIAGLSVHQAAQVARQAGRVEKETGDKGLAKEIGTRLARGMHTAGGRQPGRGGKKKGQQQAVTYHGAPRAADEMMGSRRRQQMPKKIPDIEQFADTVVALLDELPNARMRDKLGALIKWRAELQPRTRKRLENALRATAKQFITLADRLAAPSTRQDDTQRKLGRAA